MTERTALDDWLEAQLSRDDAAPLSLPKPSYQLFDLVDGYAGVFQVIGVTWKWDETSNDLTQGCWNYLVHDIELGCLWDYDEKALSWQVANKK